jgi:hypothetical protein
MLLKGKSNAELKEAQELKDIKDFKYSTYQSLNALSEGIGAFSLQHEKVMAKTESDRKALLIEFENLREWIRSSFQYMHQRLGDVESKLCEALHEFIALKTESAAAYVTRKEFNDLLASLESQMVSNHLKQTLKTDNLAHDLGNLQGQVKQDLESLLKNLTPIIPEIDPVDTKIDERFQVFKVDFDGLIKEITLLKKSVFYDQKKFENIYTLIERLQK